MKTFNFQREIAVEAPYDLVVCGGGPAGVSAAIAAGRLGAKVLLVEATGCLGGMGTSGLVTAFDPMANGERGLVGGLMREMVETLHARGFTGPHVTPDFWGKRYHCWTPFNAEGYKLLLDDLCTAAGVEVRFFTHLIDVDAADRHLPGLFKFGRTMAALNAGHVFKMDALRCRSLSDGMMKGRKLAQEYLAFYRKYVPGCENMEHATTASLMGVRESRRIVGEYELGYKDYLARRQFPDQIGVFNKAVDIHVYDDSPQEYERFCKEFGDTGRMKPGECYGIPYGILVPKGWSNLWVAGRCASTDVQVHGSIRVQPAASMMGQASGTAAVQSIRTGQTAGDLDTAQLVESLRVAKAYLPQEKLSRAMTH